MMQWERDIEMAGKKTSEQGVSNDDKFKAVLGDEKAEVEYTVGTQWNFGEAKVTCTVRITCNQDENTIRSAAYLAFDTARSLCQQGLDILVPPVPQPQPPPIMGGGTYPYPPGVPR